MIIKEAKASTAKGRKKSALMNDQRNGRSIPFFENRSFRQIVIGVRPIEENVGVEALGKIDRQ